MKSRGGSWAVAALAAVALAGIVATLNQPAYGTALSADRATLEAAGKNISMTAGSNTFYAGAMLCENGSAVAVPAADASGYVVIGKNQTHLDNTAANYSATAKVTAQRGVFRWVNGGSFTDANIGDLCYVEDDQTVTTAAAATYDVVAGVIVDVDASGVWVDTYAIGGSGAASLTTVAVSGAATLSSTLSVAGATALNGGLTCDTSKFTVADTSGNTHIGGTLMVVGATTATGTVTLVAMPILTATNAAGAVVGSPLNNLPTGATTNAVWIKIGVGAVSYVVPGYALP